MAALPVYRITKSLNVLEGHTYAVSSLAFSPDGKVLVSGSSDHKVRTWDVTLGKPLALMHGHSEGVISVAFSPDGTVVASCSYDNTVRTWGAKSGTAIRVIETVGYFEWVCGANSLMHVVAFSPDGAAIVSGYTDGTVRTWSLWSGIALDADRGPGSTMALSRGGDGAIIASGSDYHKAVVTWNLTTRRMWTMTRHTDRVNTVAVSRDGTAVASGSNDKTVRTWDAALGTALAVMKGHTRAVLAVGFSADGTVVVSGSCDKTVRMWVALSGEALMVLLDHNFGSNVCAVAFAPDGAHVASASEDGAVRVWSARTVIQARQEMSAFLLAALPCNKSSGAHAFLRKDSQRDACRSIFAFLSPSRETRRTRRMRRLEKATAVHT